MSDDTAETVELPEPKPRKPAGRPILKDNQEHQFRGKRKFTPAEVTAALKANFGNYRHSALALMAADRNGLGRTIDPSAIRMMVKRRPEMQDLVDKGRTIEAIDLAEGVIIRALRAGDTKTARWFLEQQAKHLGYGRTADMQALILDPSKLSVEQLQAILDPERLSDAQLDAVLEFLAKRFDGHVPGYEAQGPIIEHEALPAPEAAENDEGKLRNGHDEPDPRTTPIC